MTHPVCIWSTNPHQTSLKYVKSNVVHHSLSLALCFPLIIHFSGTELSEGSFWRWATQGLKQMINHYESLLLENCTDQITCRSTALPGGPASVGGLKITVFICREGDEERADDTERKRSNQGEWVGTKKSKTIQSKSNLCLQANY